jgi:DNA-binding NtrC family response regulator
MDDLIQRVREVQCLSKLVGESPPFQKSIAEVDPIAKSGAPVLITGETGTGKELVARALHYLSQRAAYPFVPINCGVLSESLLEDELFGHERGAFTDAHNERRGLFAEAKKGTLFLDEIDSLSPKAQIDLLRVLQEKTYRSIGSSIEREADVRIISASNASLEKLIGSGLFRSDLYYRISVFPISLPALRERKEDIVLLARHFLHKHAPQGTVKAELSPRACEALLAYSWPGNVRELENSIVRGIHLAQASRIEVEHLGLGIAAENGEAKLERFQEMKRMVIANFEREYLLKLMSRHEGNITRAARTAGKERRDLGKLLKKHAVNPKQFRPQFVPTPI